MYSSAVLRVVGVFRVVCKYTAVYRASFTLILFSQCVSTNTYDETCNFSSTRESGIDIEI